MMEVFHIITSSNGEEVKHMTKFMKSLGIGALALTMLVGCQTKQPTDNKAVSYTHLSTVCLKSLHVIHRLRSLLEKMHSVLYLKELSTSFHVSVRTIR